MPAKPKLFKFIFQSSGDLEISRGLRALVAFAIPLAIGELTSHRAVGNAIGLSALYFILGDVGGFYPTRAKALIGTIITCAISLFLATLLPETWWLKVLFTFGCMFAVGYVGVYGAPGVMGGIVTGLFFLYAIELPEIGF